MHPRFFWPFCFLLFAYTQNDRGVLRENGTDYALFFAVDDYSNTQAFENLKNPVKDAKAIEKELVEMFGFTSQVYENPAKEEVYEVLRQWQHRTFQANDQLFIFFSGHGDFDEFEKKGYFVTSDNRRIDLTSLGNIITQIPCRHILTAIDACYSGTIDQEIAFKGLGERLGLTQETERTRLINNLLRNKSRLLLTSGGKERTPDGIAHSPFSGAIINSLRSAYGSGDGLLTYQDLLGRLQRVNPVPHEGSLRGHEEGQFVFEVQNGQFVAPPAVVRQEPILPRPKKLAGLDPNMVYIAGGTFTMGCLEERDQACGENEMAAERTRVSSFYLSKHECTQQEWLNIMGSMPGGSANYSCLECPAAGVTWDEIEEFLQRLNQRTGMNYRLPTEAEWEFAARGGNKTKHFRYAGGAEIDPVAWYSNNSTEFEELIDFGDNGQLKKVGTKRANELGLYDMSGNVWEWVEDWYAADLAAVHDISRFEEAREKVVRGGGVNAEASNCRLASRRYESVESINY